MILDVANECAMLNFAMGTAGTGSSISRMWTIKVTQYECGDDMAGPAGCLQYFTGKAGNFRSFNFPPDGVYTETST